MSIETTLYDTLKADVSVQGYVSSGSPLVHRIFPNLAPDDVTVPYITFQVISYISYDFVKGAPDRHRKVIQINCISNSALEAKNLAEAVRAALDEIGYLQGGGEDYFPETQRHRATLDFSFIQSY